MHERDGKPAWAPRVPPALIRRLYRRNALGLVDDELIDDVGLRLLERCRDMLTVGRAHMRAAACPRCGEQIARTFADGEVPTSTCGWSLPWSDYFETYRHHQLMPGAVEPALQEFAETFPTLPTARDRMLAIDLLLHRWHWAAGLATPSRPVGLNFIEGSFDSVVALLDDISGTAPHDDEWRRHREVAMTARRPSPPSPRSQ
jgi:hypothetical protein